MIDILFKIYSVFITCTHSSPQMQLMRQWESHNSGKKGRKRTPACQHQQAPKRQLVVRDTNESHHEHHNDVSNSNFSDHNEEFSDSDHSMMDQLIEGLDQEDTLSEGHVDDQNVVEKISDRDNLSLNGDPLHRNDAHRLLSLSSISAKGDDIFCKDYVVDPPLLHLHPISETLAATITQWCHVPPKKDDINYMFKQALVSINVEGLYPVRINEPVFRKLPLKARIQDQRLRGLNTFLAWGVGPVLSIFNDLCQMEAAVASSTSSTLIQLNDNKQIMIDGMTVDFKDMRTKIGQALKLLTTAHSVLLQHCKASPHP